MGQLYYHFPDRRTKWYTSEKVGEALDSQVVQHEEVEGAHDDPVEDLVLGHLTASSAGEAKLLML